MAPPIFVAVGRRLSSAFSKMSCSIFASVSSGSLKPSRQKNLMPLSWYGLCEAEITAPASQRIDVVRFATAGVGKGPTSSTSTPMDMMPDASAFSIR